MHSPRRSVKEKMWPLQMHPVLRQMKPMPKTDICNVQEMSEEGEGLARISSTPDTHPKVAIKKDASEAFVQKQNVLRDNSGNYGEEIRDLQYKAGQKIHLNSERVLTDDDFLIPDSQFVSPAKAHLQAASLVTAYEQSVQQEKSFQESFNNHVRTLLTREEVTIGLMHLWDFIEALQANPMSKCLTSQLFLIIQHCRDEGYFKDTLLNILEPEGRWLVDLINILQSIVVQETKLSLTEKVAAINYAVLSLGKFYAKKIYNTVFVPLDKEIKIDTFYMRMVLKVLSLSNDIGIYRNEKMQRITSNTRKQELSDVELMHHLRKVFAESTNDFLEYVDED